MRRDRSLGGALMMRFSIASLAILLAGFFASASAQDWEPEERLIVPIPVGWASVGTDAHDSGRLTVYRSAGQPTNDQIGVQRFFGIVHQAPLDVATRMLEGLPDNCRQEGYEVTTPEPRNGHELAIASVRCAPQQDDGTPAEIVEVSRALVLAGDQDLHIVTRVWQGSPGGPDDPTNGVEGASAWSQFFDAITYCAVDGC